MRIALIQFPGTTSVRETRFAVERAGMTPVDFFGNDPIEALVHFSGYILMGGFSYEDRSRAGVIAARHPLINLLREQAELGKPILGICNGAQILVEANLVLGLQQGLALTQNIRMQYYNASVYIRLAEEHQQGAFTRYSQDKVLCLPVAHSEGRFVTSGKDMTLQGVFQYCDNQGKVKPDFPINPNGSVNNIAAVSNPAGNVLAMMPHPERASDGDVIFQSMRAYIAENHLFLDGIKALHYQERRHCEPCFPVPIRAVSRDREAGRSNPVLRSYELIIASQITDNHALTVQQILRQQGLPVTLTRQIHWEIECSAEAYDNILSSQVLFHEHKEKRVCGVGEANQLTFLIRAKEDLYGLQKKQWLIQHHGITGISSIRHGIIWHVACDGGVNEELANQVIQSYLLFNPVVSDCYRY